MSERAATWLLFAALVVAMPVPYYMFVVSGLLPVSAIAVLQFRGVWGFKVVNALHLLIYLPLLYLVARFCARRLLRFPHPWGVASVVALAAAVLILCGLPVYGIGHNAGSSVNIMELFSRGL